MIYMWHDQDSRFQIPVLSLTFDIFKTPQEIPFLVPHSEFSTYRSTLINWSQGIFIFSFFFFVYLSDLDNGAAIETPKEIQNVIRDLDRWISLCSFMGMKSEGNLISNGWDFYYVVNCVFILCSNRFSLKQFIQLLIFFIFFTSIPRFASKIGVETTKVTFFK